jgi:hypothetical protein
MPECKCCAGNRVADCGPLPPLKAQTFGGVKASEHLEAGHLWHCGECDLYFRYPYAPQAVLTKLYEDLPPSIWDASEPRRVWNQILPYGERYAHNKIILDVGCFAGDFLAWWPQGWRKLGIEPCAPARRVAESRGVQMLANGIGCPVAADVKPSIITMIDVIEHMEHPIEALRYLRDLLDTKGILAIFTGAADSLSWRLFGKDYWYSALPEHVSFYTRSWFDYAASKLDMKVIGYHRMSSVESTASRYWGGFARLSLYTATQRLRERNCPERILQSLPGFHKSVRWTTIPWWQQAKDHMLVILAR